MILQSRLRVVHKAPADLMVHWDPLDVQNTKSWCGFSQTGFHSSDKAVFWNPDIKSGSNFTNNIWGHNLQTVGSSHLLSHSAPDCLPNNW